MVVRYAFKSPRVKVKVRVEVGVSLRDRVRVRVPPCTPAISKWFTIMG